MGWVLFHEPEQEIQSEPPVRWASNFALDLPTPALVQPTISVCNFLLPDIGMWSTAPADTQCSPSPATECQSAADPDQSMPLAVSRSMGCYSLILRAETFRSELPPLAISTNKRI